MSKIPRVLGIGTDITSVQRILTIIQRGSEHEDRFIAKVLHRREIEEYKELRVDDEFDRAARFLASRWAFKEAMVKASGSTSLHYPGMYLLKEVKGEKP